MRDFFDLLASHASVRKFLPQPIPDEHVTSAVTAAQMASTSSHVQAYSILRITDSETRARLVELTGGQPYVEQSGAFFVVCADERRHRLLFDREGSTHERNLETYLVAVIDASLFAQNLALAFESMAYGICFIGGLRNDLDTVDELLELPEHVMPLYGLCVGVPEERSEPKPRLPLDAVLFDDRYPSDEAMLRAMDTYDADMQQYYASRGVPGRSWSKGILRKFHEARRTYLHRYYAGKGGRLS